MISRRNALAGAAAVAAGDAARAAVAADGQVVIRRQYVDCRYGQLHLHRARPTVRAGATPVVCLHPTPASGRYFRELMKDLATDREVIAVDTPGYGESDSPPAPVGIDAYAGAIAEGLAALGYGRRKPVDLLAYHTGNLIAAELALAGNGLVRRLVMTAIPHYADPARRAAAAARVDRWSFSESPKPILDLWEGTVVKRAAGVTLRQSVDQFLERLRPGDREWWAYDAVFAYDSGAALPRIVQPTAILNPHGALYEQTLTAARIMPRATLVDLPELSHGVFQVGTQTIAARARDFLDRA
jgi:pimeloyl-ACP methyl ester carboxylesterase